MQGCIQRPTGAKEMLGAEPKNCLQPEPAAMGGKEASHVLAVMVALARNRNCLFGTAPLHQQPELDSHIPFDSTTYTPPSGVSCAMVSLYDKFSIPRRWRILF